MPQSNFWEAIPFGITPMATPRNGARAQQVHAIDSLRRAKRTFQKRKPSRAELLRAGRAIALAVQTEIQLALKARIAAETVASGTRRSRKQSFAGPGKADLRRSAAKIVKGSSVHR